MRVEEKEADRGVARPGGDEDACREMRRRDAHLDPIEPPAAPLGSGRRLGCRRVLGRDLVERSREDDLAAHDLREEPFALLSGAELAHGKGAEEKRRPHRNGRHCAPDFLEEDAELEESEAAPPDRRGQGYPEEVRLGELGPELVIEPVGALLDLLQTVVRGVVAENLPGEVAQRLLLLGEREVHRPTLSAGSGASSGPPWR